MMISVREVPDPQPGLLPSTLSQELEVVLHETGIHNCVRVSRRLDWLFPSRVECHL